MKKILIAILFVFGYAALFASISPNKHMYPEMVPNQTMALLTNFPDDSNKDADKQALIDQVTKEVFTNYSNKIDSLKKYIRWESLMMYIDDYLRDETAIIELKIADKTYIQQYANTQKDWEETDYAEVAAKLKVSTLDRIKDIMIDVQNSTPGLYTMTKEKLWLLEKKVKEGINAGIP
jgi:hypothetical protein